MTEPKRPPGRPRVPNEQRQTERIEIRMTPAQRDKLKQLGGAQWVRDKIEKAKAAGA